MSDRDHDRERRDVIVRASKPLSSIDLDIRDLARRKAEATRDAVEAEIGLVRTVRLLESRVERMAEAYADEADNAPEISQISACALAIQRCCNSYHALSAANASTLDELRAMSEAVAARTDEETVEEAVSHLQLVRRRKRKSLLSAKRPQSTPA